MKRSITGLLLIGFLILALAGCDTSSNNKGASHVDFLWKMNSNDITSFSYTHVSSRTVDTSIVSQCDSSFKIIPTPNTEDYPETKMETKMSQTVFNKWVNSSYLFMDIYVTEKSNLNSCFVYVWDNNKSQWVDGVFYQNKFNVGWNRVVLNLSATIKDLDSNHSYQIGFGFRHLPEGCEPPHTRDGYTVPGSGLNAEPIYIGGIGVY